MKRFFANALAVVSVLGLFAAFPATFLAVFGFVSGETILMLAAPAVLMTGYCMVRDKYERQRFEMKYPGVHYYPGYAFGYGHVEPMKIDGKIVVAMRQVDHGVYQYEFE